MLEQLFGSKTRVVLLKLFLRNPSEKYFVRELTRNTGLLINSIRRELDNLINLGIIAVVDSDEVSEEENNNSGEAVKESKRNTRGLPNKKYYTLNQQNIFLGELKLMLEKAEMFLEKGHFTKLLDLPNVQLIILSGKLIGDKESSTDLLVVGNIDKSTLNTTIISLEKKMQKEINFTHFNKQEYIYRKELGDKFLQGIINNPQNIILLDSISTGRMNSR